MLAHLSIAQSNCPDFLCLHDRRYRPGTLCCQRSEPARTFALIGSQATRESVAQERVRTPLHESIWREFRAGTVISDSTKLKRFRIKVRFNEDAGIDTARNHQVALLPKESIDC
jgi:hypothetical protein